VPTRPVRYSTGNKQSSLKLSRKIADTKRGSASSRGYGTKWRKARDAWLMAYPLCAEHESKGVLVQANVVDHIVPHGGDWKLFWDRKNWQSLCTSCHNSKTAKEDGGFGNKKKIKGGG
jgi:5-methylcytosine-specific restriction protein A